MTSARLRRAAVNYCKALMAEFDVEPDELVDGAPPPAPQPVQRRTEPAPRPTPPARPPAAAVATVAPPARPPKLRARRTLQPRGLEPTVRIAPAAPPALGVNVVTTELTKYTVCPSARFDPRYQLDPNKPVEGAGLLADWRRRRGDK